MSNLSEIKNLKKYFETRNGYLHAVDNVSFSIKTGEPLGVVGESGCGKSMLGRVLIHLLENADGELLYRDNDITKVSRKELSKLRREMQIIFQDPYLSVNPGMTVYQIISEPLVIAKSCTRKEISDNIMVMYLGQTVEYADNEEFFKNPVHPYTQALLSAVPLLIPLLDVGLLQDVLTRQMSAEQKVRFNC